MYWLSMLEVAMAVLSSSALSMCLAAEMLGSSSVVFDRLLLAPIEESI